MDGIAATSHSGSADGPLSVLAARQAAGTVKPDAAQRAAVVHLQRLHEALAGYTRPAPVQGLKRWLGLGAKPAEPPRGLYVFGPVGRGKSMLMDMFFDGAPVAAKRRVHFHAFMLEVHERAHALRSKGGDPLPEIARAVAERATLLCFDEFQVTDIADAMILGRLFEAMLAAGVVVVATSNVAPKNLYKDGLQRDRFLPFIDLIVQRLDVVELDGGIDHRLARMKGRPVYHVPADAEAQAALDQAFADLTDDSPGKPMSLEVQGRQVTIPRTALGVARADFDTLCKAALGPADYLAIAARFHTLVLDRIPQLSPARRNEAKRFVTLIDALYERRAKLIASAEAEPQALYPTGDGSFEFQRTVSRLMEMQAQDYWEAPHLG